LKTAAYTTSVLLASSAIEQYIPDIRIYRPKGLQSYPVSPAVVDSRPRRHPSVCPPDSRPRRDPSARRPTPVRGMIRPPATRLARLPFAAWSFRPPARLPSAASSVRPPARLLSSAWPFRPPTPELSYSFTSGPPTASLADPSFEFIIFLKKLNQAADLNKYYVTTRVESYQTVCVTRSTDPFKDSVPPPCLNMSMLALLLPRLNLFYFYFSSN
jgi:hypothetical protein